MNQIIEIKILDSYQIVVKFHDGFERKIAFEPLIGKGISRKLLDPDFFKKVIIDEGGGLLWPNGFDVCPNFLRDYEPNSDQKALSI